MSTGQRKTARGKNWKLGYSIVRKKSTNVHDLVLQEPKRLPVHGELRGKKALHKCCPETTSGVGKR